MAIQTRTATLRKHRTPELDPLSSAEVYYGQSHGTNFVTRTRTFSTRVAKVERGKIPFRRRRTSHDEQNRPRRFLLPVEETLERLLASEDTDNNMQITIDDAGPKMLCIGTAASNGFNHYQVRGTYPLANLLQELTLAKDYGRKNIILDEARLHENPVGRLSRLIKSQFWPGLTRSIDGANIARIAVDPKDWTDNPRPRIYIPRGASEQYAYYLKVAEQQPELHLDVQWLKDDCSDPSYVRDLNEAPGLLALAMEEYTNDEGQKDMRGMPFVVPGGRFNELYGWDSYMESLGLLVNDRVDLVKGMITNFCFCIKHYGKILNANRTYYLCRSQPPFLTDMVLRVFERIKHEPNAIDFLRTAFLAAIKEYYGVWMSDPRLDRVTGLSRYRPDGIGVPPETEASHFVHLLEPYAKKYCMTFNEFVCAYNNQEIKESELDEYFMHDRAVRESGHDTTYRLEDVCANLATVDLNSLLFKIEQDVERVIRTVFGDRLVVPDEWLPRGFRSGHIETSSVWERRARKRRKLMEKYMWNEKAGMYFDYDTVLQKQTMYESATTFWTMWAGVPSPRQAMIMVPIALRKLEKLGGLVSGTEESRGLVGVDRPDRQWDYPFGWAPQQMLAWVGLQRYGYHEEAARLAYRWLYMVIKAFVDYNGVVVEKYDVTRPIDPHRVQVEYGNQGADFKGVPREGFGWVNASYVYGLTFLTAHMKRALGTMTPWDIYSKAVSSAVDDA